jgi:phospholipid/cholesterol/gamma-HCH transport system substrate-binding protein
METKANYTLVGAFVMIFLISIILFIMWMTRIGFSHDTTKYDIYFEGSVTGLKEGSTVLYRGVPVGKVEEINIDPLNVEKIHVVIVVQGNVPIQEDTYALLELQGITGASFIQLKGGTTSSKRLVPEAEKSRATIPARSSILEEVASSLPKILHQIAKTFDDLRTVFTDDSRRVFEETLNHIHSITKSLSPGSEGDVEDLIRNIKSSVKEFQSVALEIKNILKDNRQNINEFSGTGLPAFTQFLTEGKETLEVVRRVTEALERSPTRFLYNDPAQGVTLP